MAENHEPGWSNSKPDSPQRTTTTDPTAAEVKVVSPDTVEDKTVTKATAKRAARKG